VRSARFAGPEATDKENLDKLMREAPAGSGLRYVCALAYVDPGRGIEHVVFGSCTGTLAAEARGSRGFGYDPAFLPDGDQGGRTMAELADTEKDAISHRAGAVAELLHWLAGHSGH
jgi:XTP/dITP diphosphohydrolase